MVHDIAETAGRVWQYLHENEQVSLKSIVKGTELKQREVERAIGWLAREGKVYIEMRGKQEMVMLKE